MQKSCLRTMVLILGFVVLMVCSASNGMTAEKVTTIKIGTVIPKDHPLSDAVYRMADIVSNKTAGRIKIVYYPSSQLGSGNEQISGVKMGTQEIYFGATGQTAIFDRRALIIAPPFAYKDKEDKLAVINSPYFAEIKDDVHKKTGLVLLGGDWFTGYRNMFAKRPIKKLEDLKGLKLRVPRSQAKLFAWSKMGASPTPTAIAETYMALKENVVDAVENYTISLHYDHFDEVCKYFTLTEHDANFNIFMVNGAFWGSLAEKDRKIIVDAVTESGKWANSKMGAFVKEVKEIMRKEENVQFITLAPEEKDRFMKIGSEIMHMLEIEKKWWGPGVWEKIKAKDSYYFAP